MYRRFYNAWQFDIDNFMGDLEVMTLAEAWARIQEIMSRIKYGEIRLIIRGGVIKYINVMEEYVPEKPGDRGKTKF